MGADAYTCDAAAEFADVGAALAVTGFRVAAGMLGFDDLDVVSGEDLLDLVEAHRWADVLADSPLDLSEHAVLLVAARLRVSVEQLDSHACQETLAVGIAAAAVFHELAEVCA
jgi:hypothetical protein